MTTNATSNTILERVKFYADTPQEANKYFCWQLGSLLTLKQALHRFLDKGWNIRAAWYEKVDTETGEVVENTKLNLQEIIDEYVDQKHHHRK